MTTLNLTRHALVLLAALLALPAPAQPLIDHVPNDAALYLGWRGAADLGPGYEGSNLQGVLEQTGLLETLPQLVDALQQFGEGELDPEAAELLGAAGTLWSSVWANGGVLYVMPPEPNGPPIPRVAMLFRKGDNEAQVRDAVSRVVGMINEAEQAPAFMGGVGDAVFMSIGFDAGQAALDSLANTQAYKQAAAQVQQDGALVVYVNAREWIGQVDRFVDQMRQQAAEHGGDVPDFVRLWPDLRDVSGLSGVNRLMISAGFDQKSWKTEFFLDAPAPRTGILSLLEGAPIAGEHLWHVPRTATYLQVLTIEPSRVLEVTRDILNTVEPGAVADLNEALAEAGDAVGVDLEKELLNGMGPVWSVYIDPMIAGNGFASMVLVNDLRNPAAVEGALDKLTASANEALADGLGEESINIRLLTREVDGQRITHLGVPLIAPAWMVHDGKLYLALYPQGLEMALEHDPGAETSILANDAFGRVMDRIDDGIVPTGVSFVDLPETAAEGYGMNLMIVQAFAGASEMINGQPAAMRMPPVGKVLPFVEPSGSVTWVDDAGMHMRAIEPFPGSALLGPAKGAESTVFVAGPLALGIMLPALGQAREAARDVQAMNQMRQVVIGMHAYTADNNDQMPDDIVQLIEYLGDDTVLITPNSIHAEARPFNFDQFDQPRRDRWLRQNSSFVLVPLGNFAAIQNAPEAIAVFQRPDDAIGDGSILIGWADGHVTREWDLEWVNDQLNQQAGKTMDQLIQRQEQQGAQ